MDIIEHYNDLYKEQVFDLLLENSKGRSSVFKLQKRLFELYPETGVMIRDKDSKIVGIAHYRKQNDKSKNKEINEFVFKQSSLHYYLNMIYVTPDSRRHNHGTEFIEYLEYLAGTKNIPIIMFGTEKENSISRAFFKKNGYVEKEIISLNGKPYIILKKIIPPRPIGAGFNLEYAAKDKHN